MVQTAATNVGRLRNLWFCLTILYALWKLRALLRSIRKYQKADHCCLQNGNSIQSPSKSTFPQYFQNPDGLWIHIQNWMLSQFQAPKGVVILSHGLAEHIQRYEHFARALHLQGFAVYGIDHQGHGLSDGDRCYVKQFADYTRDLLIASRRIKEEYADVPVFLFGHSMGGLIASYVALQEPRLFDGGVILSSPFFGVAAKQDSQWHTEQSAWVLRMGVFLATHMPKLPLIQLYNDGLSHDHKIKYHLMNDHLHYTDGLIPIRTASVLTHAADRMIHEHCAEIEYPFFIFGGADDPLCNGSKWKVFYDRAQSADKEFAVFEGLFHECLNETPPQQQKVIKAVIDWMSSRC